jgi:chromosome segregation ATPase
LDFIKKTIKQVHADNADLHCQCGSLEKRLVLLGKKLNTSEIEVQEWKKRFERLGSDYESLEEKSSSLSYMLETSKKEAADWRSKFEELSLRIENKDGILQEDVALNHGQISVGTRFLKPKEEAVDWGRRHDAALNEAKELKFPVQEVAIKQAQEREDAIRADFSSAMALKVFVWC